MNHFTSLNYNTRRLTIFIFTFSGGQGKSTDTGNAGQGFTSETHGLYLCQVVCLSDLTRGMSLKTHECIIALHACSIIGNANKTASSRIDLHRDALGLSVDGVFNQFLDNTGRPFNHLAGSDLIGNMVRQHSNAIHVTILNTPSRGGQSPFCMELRRRLFQLSFSIV